jgi:peptide/nickel transport system permease protein
MSARRTAIAALGRMAAIAIAGGLLCATMVRMSPGFGLDERQLDPGLSRESQDALRRAHEGERNPLRFYAAYLERMMAGDLGFSSSLNQPIRQLLADRVPATLELMVWGIAGAWALAAALAVPAVSLRLPGVAAGCAVLSGIPASLPAAVIALLLFRWGAPAGCAIALVLFPRLFQYMRSLMARSSSMPHVLLARAKGLRAGRILRRHVLLPARGELIALGAVSLNMGFGAAVAVEAICDVPGIGQLAWKTAMARDLPVLVILTMLVTMVTQAFNLVADVASSAPRSHA